MQGYSKGSKGSSIMVHYNFYVEASTQGHRKRSVEYSIRVHYNGESRGLYARLY
jgi:hypothetical protein